MACEACSARFSFFKRKKQCTDCLRYFCSECVIKRGDKIVNCDSCRCLSQRPLFRSQVMQMRSRDLRQYLLAKKIFIAGCVEKNDLVSLIMLHANGTDDRPTETNHSIYNRTEPIPETTGTQNIPPSVETTNAGLESRENVPSPPTQGDSLPEAAPSQSESLPEIWEPSSEQHTDPAMESARDNSMEIEEISDEASENDNISTNCEPEPIVTEQEDVSETIGRTAEQQEEQQQQRSEMFTEIPVWSDFVKLSDIKSASELEYLNIKQLKTLLSTNRVDFKGCVERRELIVRANRLWEEYKQSRTDVERLSEEDLCKICWDAPIECVILECGHMACCINCGKQMSECPICKQYVVRVVRFFKA